MFVAGIALQSVKLFSNGTASQKVHERTDGRQKLAPVDCNRYVLKSCLADCTIYIGRGPASPALHVPV